MGALSLSRVKKVSSPIDDGTVTKPTYAYYFKYIMI